MTETPCLFVYGTLRRATGTEWSRRLASVSSFVDTGRTRGALFRVDSYPGMVASARDDEWVVGEVCRLDQPESFLPVLDGYEKCSPADPQPHEYERRVVDVILDNGETVPAWVYVYLLDTADKAPIATGDFLRPPS